ncbi:hypothetical protein KIN20_019522 [Parelaphostrongylus tenuis]|uniref:Uncharacterized protein n=1 Tax=Parelaphostrongylus tenuis TaxID=148309 RepID=A0AAD5MRP4_PARTN|nr:hypothetical protein KIN20_019522 [Parelaphostrongylus tenuis]
MRTLNIVKLADTEKVRRESAKENEFSKPENVCKLKAGCNFLMELIGRVCQAQQKNYVCSMPISNLPFLMRCHGSRYRLDTERWSPRTTAVIKICWININATDSVSVNLILSEKDQNGILRESTLRFDNQASLQMIRDYTYLYRNPNTDGYRSVRNLHMF